LRLAKPALFYQRRYVFSTHSYKLFGTTGIARGIRMTRKDVTEIYSVTSFIFIDDKIFIM